jgi:hypothetical protein
METFGFENDWPVKGGLKGDGETEAILFFYL